MYFSWEVYLDSKFVAGSIYLYLYHIFCLRAILLLFFMFLGVFFCLGLL